MKDKKILLMRHGTTDWNVQMRFQGRTEVPLNEQGEAQARSVRARIEAWNPQTVLVSPMGRAVRTAVLSTGAREENLTIEPHLTEIGFGDWEGMGLSSLKENSVYRQWMNSPFSVAVSNAEPIGDVTLRVKAVLKRIEESDDERFLLISHGGTLRVLIAAALKIPVDVTWKYFAMDNCSLSGLTARKGSFILRFYNDRLHSLHPGGGYAPLPIQF